MKEQKPLAFGEWVRAKREEVRLTLRSFAVATGIDPGRYERGILPAPQNQATLMKIAEALTLRPGSKELRQFLDLAAASAGRIPPDIANDPALLAKMPFLFRAARKKLTKYEPPLYLIAISASGKLCLSSTYRPTRSRLVRALPPRRRKKAR